MKSNYVWLWLKVTLPSALKRKEKQMQSARLRLSGRKLSARPKPKQS